MRQEDESVGQQRLQQIHGWPAQMWIQTSYNTRGNKYYNADGSEGDQSKKFRGNYAGIGYSWDEDNQYLFKNNHTLVGQKILQLLFGMHQSLIPVTNDGLIQLFGIGKFLGTKQNIKLTTQKVGSI